MHLDRLINDIIVTTTTTTLSPSLWLKMWCMSWAHTWELAFVIGDRRSVINVGYATKEHGKDVIAQKQSDGLTEFFLSERVHGREMQENTGWDNGFISGHRIWSSKEWQESLAVQSEQGALEQDNCTALTTRSLTRTLLKSAGLVQKEVANVPNDRKAF